MVLGQQQQAAPAAQAPPQAPAQPRHLPPAAVHFVNIGEKLEGDYKFGYDTGKFSLAFAANQATHLLEYEFI